MKRGDVITVALQGDLGKPRPALIIQADVVPATFRTVTLLPITGTIEAAPLFRITIEPSGANGLKKVSQVMVDKTMTHPRDRIGQVVGTLEPETMLRVTRSLATWLGIG